MAPCTARMAGVVFISLTLAGAVKAGAPAALLAVPYPDLAIAKTVQETTASIGSVLHYTIVIENRGATNALSTSVTDLLPRELLYHSHTGGSYTNGGSMWSFGTLAPGATATLLLNATVQPLIQPDTFLGQIGPIDRGENFGCALAPLPDGGLAVGADHVDIGTGDTGAVYLFDGNGTGQRMVLGPRPERFAFFGASLALAGTNRLAVGAPQATIGTNQVGLVYIVDLEGNHCTTLTNPTPFNLDAFGQCLCALDDGGVVVASPGGDLGATNAGTVHVFAQDGTHEVQIPNPAPGRDDGFGGALATFGTNLIAVGVKNDDAGATNSGSVYLFDRQGQLLRTLANPTPGLYDLFGQSIAFLDADHLAVGAPGEDSLRLNAGAVYIFRLDGTLETTIQPPASIGQYFGASIAPWNSDSLVIGAPSAGVAAVSSGQAFVYTRTGTLQYWMQNPAPAANDLFGVTVAVLDEEHFVVGAPQDDTRLPNGGSAYRYSPRLGGYRIDNTATVKVGTGSESDLGNNTAMASTLIGPTGDIALALSQSLAEATGNQVNVYTVLASNTTDAAATGLRISITLPAGGVTVTTTNCPEGRIVDGVPRQWELSRLEPHATASVRFRGPMVRASVDAYVVTAQVKRIASAQADTDPGNDTAVQVCRVVSNATLRTLPVLAVRTPFGVSAPEAGEYTFPSGTVVTATLSPSVWTQYPHVTIPAGWRCSSGAKGEGTGTQVVFTVTADTTLQWLWSTSLTFSADLVLTKTASGEDRALDAPIDFTLVVSNRGPHEAQGVVVTDSLPASLTYIAHENGTYAPLGGRWTIGTIGAGCSTTLLLHTRIRAAPAYLAALRPQSPQNQSRFGYSVAALSSNLIAVGAPSWQRDGLETGAALLFDAEGNQCGILLDPAGVAGDELGAAMTRFDEQHVLVGAPGGLTGTNRVGRVCLFRTDGTLVQTWTPPAPATQKRFGACMDRLDSGRIVIGAPEDDYGASGAGAVYVFTTNGVCETVVTNPSPAASDAFGWSVAGGPGDLIAVGAYLDDSHAADVGAAYLFTASGGLLTTFRRTNSASSAQLGVQVQFLDDRVAISERQGSSLRGAVHLFDLSGNLTGSISNPLPSVLNDYFGDALARTPEGGLLVGIPNQSEGTPVGGFSIHGPDGLLVTHVVNTGGSSFDRFGCDVAMLDHDRFVIGCYGSDADGSNAGRAFVFGRQKSGIYVANTATVSTTTHDAAPGDNRDVSIRHVGTSGDVAVAIAQHTVRATQGETNVYTFAVSNAGACTMTGLRIQTAFPAFSLSVTGAVPSRGRFNLSPPAWELDRLDPGQSGTLVVHARVTAANGIVTTTVSIAAANESDWVPANNAASLVTLVGTSGMARFLTIASAHGTPEPPRGTHLLIQTGPVTARVDTLPENGPTRYAGTGWTVTGNEPAGGTGNVVVLDLTNDATLTWNWSTNHLLTIVPPARGTITGTAPGFHPAGTRVDLTATPVPGSIFLRWTGDTAGDAEDPFMHLFLDGPRSISATFAIALQRTDACDFDGDGAADFATYLPSDGRWTIVSGANGTTQAVQWGWREAYPVPADYDGDGRADLAVYHPPTGTWHIRDRATGGLLGGAPFAWGWSQTIPAPADYDGDGIADLAVYHPTAGNWYIRQRDGSLRNGRPLNWGWREASPVPADYDGDGRADPAVFHQLQGKWYVLQSANDRILGGGPIIWGALTDVPVPGDYDGDRLADLAVYRPPTGRWFLRMSGTATPDTAGIALGTRSHTAVPGDYDGDGRTDPAVYRRTTALWSALLSDGGFNQQPVGPPGALPASSAATAYELWRRQR